MAEEEGKPEEKFDFTRGGGALGFISLDQAPMLATRTAIAAVAPLFALEGSGGYDGQ